MEKAEKAGLISSQPRTVPATRNDTRVKNNLKGNGDSSPEVSMKATFEACSSHRRCWRRAQREALVRMGLAIQHVRGILDSGVGHRNGNQQARSTEHKIVTKRVTAGRAWSTVPLDLTRTSTNCSGQRGPDYS